MKYSYIVQLVQSKNSVMEGRYSNRDFTSIDLEENGSQSDDKNRDLSVQRQQSGKLLENEEITFSWSHLSVRLPRNEKRYYYGQAFRFFDFK